MSAISYYKNVSRHLNDSICAAFKVGNNESLFNSSYEDIDSSFSSILDETLKSNNINDSTLSNNKIRKRARSLDESICFVDEYIIEPEKKIKRTDKKGLDNFIRSVAVLPKTQKRKRRNSDCSDNNDEIDSKRTKNDFLCSTPIGKCKNSDLFTASEQKKNKIYNKNTFNPYGNDVNYDIKRTIILDGSNIAFHHSLGREFSVKGLEICIKYFEKLGHQVKAIVPQFRLQRWKSTDPKKLELLNSKGQIVLTPCKNLPGMNSISYDDRFILQLALELDGAIISNDNYRDLLYENPCFKKIIQNRVIGYTWCNDIFILPKDPYGRYGPHLDDILMRNY